MSDVTRVEEVFLAAVDRADPIERASYLNDACGADAELRRRVEALLAAQPKVGRFLEPPCDRTGAYKPQTQSDPPTAAGTIIAGRYKLLERIGEGGMGEVWMADQLEPIKRRVAVKLIKAGMDSRGVLARFAAERQALAVMDHPNIAKVLDASTTDDGRPYFVMELVKGTPITEFCDARRLSPKQRLELFVPICQAIQHAHMKGIIHRDIKPSNVLVALHDDMPVPKVIDFGVAKAIGQQLTENTLFTGFGALVGTPTYMAPEQATFNQLDIDTRADIYALGVLLYELLAGSPPIEKERLKEAAFDEVLRIVRDEDPPRPSQRLSTSQGKASIAAVRGSEPAKLSALMRGEIDWIVMKSLEKDRTRRYDTATALAKDVQRYLNGDAVEACPPTLRYRLGKSYRRNRAAILVGSSFASMLLVGGLLATYLAIRATNAERVAMENERIASENETQAKQEQAEAIRERDNVAKANEKLAKSIDLQQQTRYAAEMNLVQAASNAKDVNQVKRLLAAQVPKAGEVDLRGPEWFYWDRRLNQFTKEFTLPFHAPDSVGTSSNFAVFSDDAELIANFRPVRVLEGTVRKVSSQIWDTRTGEMKKQQEWDLLSLLELKGEFEKSVIRTGYLRFKNKGRDVLIVLQLQSVDDQKMGGKLANFEFLWNTQSNAVEVLTKDKPAEGILRGFNDDYTDDLSFVATLERNGTQDTLKAIRRSDGKELLRYSPDKAISVRSCKLLGNGKYLVARCSEMFSSGPKSPKELQPQMKLHTLLWKLDQPEKPLWENVDEVGTSGFNLSTRFPFSELPDGKHFREFTNTNDSIDSHVVEIETGKRVSTQQLWNRSDIPTAQQGMLAFARLCRAESADRAHIALGTENGVTLVYCPINAKVLPVQKTQIEMLDGSPALIGIRNDGSTVTLHGNATTAECKLRNWPRPNLSSSSAVVNKLVSGRVLASAGLTSRSGNHIAYAFTDTGIAGYANPDGQNRHMFVWDRAGKKVLDVSSTDREMLIGIGVTFSPDSRYVLYFVRKSKGEKPLDELVVHDLTDNRQARWTLPAGADLYYPLFTWDGKRILVVGRKVTSKDFLNNSVYTVQSARVHDFPSGQFLHELEMPKGKEVLSIKRESDEWRSIDIQSFREGQPEHTWSMETGKYLGELPPVDPARNVVRAPDGASLIGEETQGNRVVRIYMQYKGSPDNHNFANLNGSRLEVWDTAKRSAPNQPLFTINEPEAMQKAWLSPNEKRLLVYRRPQGFGVARSPATLTLYSTDTGRPLVSLPLLVASDTQRRYP